MLSFHPSTIRFTGRHRILELFQSEGTSKGHRPNPCSSQGHPQLHQVLRSPPRPWVPAGPGHHQLSGQPMQCLANLLANNTSLISSLNLPFFSLTPFPLGVLQQTRCLSVCLAQPGRPLPALPQPSVPQLTAPAPPAAFCHRTLL